MVMLRAVLFDWRGTLAVAMSDAEIVEQAFRKLGRPGNGQEIQEVVHALDRAAARPGIQEAWNRIDCDAGFHRATYELLFAAAGLGDTLADVLYAIESDPGYNRFARDVAGTLEALTRRGLKVAVVSDIHFDLRPVSSQHGLARFVDSFVLSYERGVQKPDSPIAMALNELDVAPAEALMVGDRASHDGAAVSVGIPTLLLPPLQRGDDERLDLVLRLAASPDA
jgi:FMN phosphatase YigB (HAD superfamily)